MIYEQNFLFFPTPVCLYAHACVTSSLTRQILSQARVSFSEFLSKNWNSSETEFPGISRWEVRQVCQGTPGNWACDPAVSGQRIINIPPSSCLLTHSDTTVWHQQIWFSLSLTQINSFRDAESFCQEPALIGDWRLRLYPELALPFAHIGGSWRATTPWMPSCAPVPYPFLQKKKNETKALPISLQKVFYSKQ